MWNFSSHQAKANRLQPICDKRKINSVCISSSVIFISCFIILLGQLPSCVLSESTNSNEETEGIHIASWNWDHVGVFITVTAFIVLSGLAKVGKLASKVGNIEKSLEYTDIILSYEEFAKLIYIYYIFFSISSCLLFVISSS